MKYPKRISPYALVLVGLSGLVNCGCTAFMAPRTPLPITPPEPIAKHSAGREKDMVTLPPYRIEPPDLLLITAIRVVPRPPHKLEPFDGILVRARGVDEFEPIADAYFIDPEGKIDLGPTYGKVQVNGLSIDDAQEEIRRHLSGLYPGVEVSVSLAASLGAQQISGEHLVGPDGHVNLGTYGSVYVTGMTLEEAKAAIEEQLSERLQNPQVMLDVFAYNSKKYYIITQGGGFGDNIVTVPITGNETVLDAIAQIGGISQLSSTRIFIARPGPPGMGCEQVLPVNYDEITRGAITTTNYQLLPGDRLYIEEDKWIRFDSWVSKITRPFERMFGFVSLGTAMLNRIDRFGLGNF